ncbi:alpha-amylase family glycosyl hydrolase [Mariniplasma anaerobium]|uniref:Pullulanase n=1 Tax=Mariniplasma anaerobium TaxID=2735436 RepID=A0A7U9TJ44_9MOLU|nr:alpha-amylase family glycosyl hydrolase [Mariniplasma anaerobium]BCR36438.1 pullulanase [Mariniplasma anaerobium]
MNIFIDDFKLIRIESDKFIHSIELENNRVNWLKNEGINQYFTTESDIDLHKNDKIAINHETFPLLIGLVTLTKAFEQRFRYDGPLGFVYDQNATSFYLFSPVAKQVYLMLGENRYEMEYSEPIWSVKVDGDHHLKTYYYQVKLVGLFKDVKDPYTVGASSKGSHIVDFNRAYPLSKTPIKVKNYVDSVIYEGHVRDMSINLDVTHKGLYDGLLEDSKILGSNVLTYIKKLGMTHLQFLPIFDFDDVFDDHKQLKYNWGYNPSQYFSLEGWFSKSPDDPYDRINSLRRIVDYAHQIKLGINMDVVYNHVFQFRTFPYDDLVPGYFYRHDSSLKMTDNSYCGNDVETRNYMVRRLIVDSLSHLQATYQLDGFRFDLMGLLDIDTMLLIEKTLKQQNPHIMLYGEGWNMQTEIPHKKQANMSNQSKFQGYAHFNDAYRNTMKGELHGDGLGFTMGNYRLQHKAMDVIIGSPHMFKSPSQSINYVECHDNLTFYDKMVLAHGFELPDFKVAQDLANHLIAISQGVPFYHAGQEFYRTKKGVENSYNSPDDINQITWRVKEESVKKLRALLKLRKKYKLYRQTTYNSSVTISKSKKLIIYRLEDEKNILIHYIKNYYDLEKLPLEDGKLIFPSQKAITGSHAMYVDQPGIYIVHIKK